MAFTFNPLTSQLDQTVISKKDQFIVSNPLDLTYDLTFRPISDSEVVSLNGVVLSKGASEDYTISGKTITLSSSISLKLDYKISVNYQI